MSSSLCRILILLIFLSHSDSVVLKCVLKPTFLVRLSSYRGKPHLLPMPSVVAIEERAKFLNLLMEVNRSVLVTKPSEFSLRKRELGIRKTSSSMCYLLRSCLFVA